MSQFSVVRLHTHNLVVVVPAGAGNLALLDPLIPPVPDGEQELWVGPPQTRISRNREPRCSHSVNKPGTFQMAKTAH